MVKTWSQSIRELSLLLNSIGEALILICPNPSLDTVIAGFALMESLRRIGRRASLVTPKKLTGEIAGLRIAEAVLEFIPERQIETIQSFGKNLTSTFQREYKCNPQAIYTLEIENLAHLQEFYQENKTLFQTLPVINIDYHENNAYYGRINLIDPRGKAISELITLMLYDLKLPLTPEVADLLYQGINTKTENLSPGYFTPNLLEAASICLRHRKRTQTS